MRENIIQSICGHPVPWGACGVIVPLAICSWDHFVDMCPSKVVGLVGLLHPWKFIAGVLSFGISVAVLIRWQYMFRGW